MILNYYLILSKQFLRMTSLITNQFSAFSEDDSLNRHGDEPTKNLVRKYKKKIRKLLIKYEKNPTSDLYRQIEDFQKLIRIEENSNKKKNKKKKVEEKIEESFDDIIRDFQTKYKDDDEKAKILKKDEIRKEIQSKILKIKRHSEYSAKKKRDKEHKSWTTHLKKNKDLMKVILSENIPQYIEFYLNYPDQYDFLKKYLDENSVEIDEKLTSIIETVKIEYDTFKNKYQRKSKIVRKSPKKLLK